MFNVRKLERKDTAPYEFPSLDPKKPIVLHTRPLSLDTPEVFNDAFTKKTDPTTAPTPFEQREEARTQNLETLARCCVPSWENVTETTEALDEDGKPVSRTVELACTPENVLRLLTFLDKEAGYREEISAYINWAMNTRNFREPVVSPDELGKE